MKLVDLERAAHAGLDKVEPWAKTGVVGSSIAPEHAFLSAETHASLSLSERKVPEWLLIEALYKDSRWLVRMFCTSLAMQSDDRQELTNYSYRPALVSSSEELLRVAKLGDMVKVDFQSDADTIVREGIIPPLGIDPSGSATWNRNLNHFIEANRNSVSGCPALSTESTVRPGVSMTQTFFERYIDILGERTIAHHLQQPIGQISVSSY